MAIRCAHSCIVNKHAGTKDVQGQGPSSINLGQIRFCFVINDVNHL